MLALSEGGPPLEINPQTLDTLGAVNYTPSFFSAHPKIDPDTKSKCDLSYILRSTYDRHPNINEMSDTKSWHDLGIKRSIFQRVSETESESDTSDVRNLALSEGRRPRGSHWTS